MQDHFLFDDGDPKQRGKGCDVLCRDDKRLKFKWMWNRDCENSGGPDSNTKAGQKRSPGQCSEAILENGWSLEATFWHTEYAANVERSRRPIASYCVNYDSGTKGKPPLLTRLDAQLKAEQLFEELGKDILEQCKR